MKCFYHNDMDGRCAGSIVAQYTNSNYPDDYFEVDYVQLLPIDKISKDETVYLVDYSFKLDTVWQLDKILSITKNVIWADHHSSSLRLLEERPDLKNIKGIIKDGISGAALIYMYLYECEFEKCPLYIKTVSDYDTWAYKYGNNTICFKLGLETCKFDALDEIWKALYNDNFNEDPLAIFLAVGVNGEVIKDYIDEDNEYYLSQFGYESTLAGYKCYVVNKKSNSWIFGDKIKEYPFVVVYVFDGKQYVYSLFSENPNVDCSKIAESFGGGGNTGAAGFSSEKMLLYKN